MLGSITFGTNYIEIVPVVTREQQQERKKRSADSGAKMDGQMAESVELKSQYDALANTHLVEIKQYPEVAWAEPLRAGID